MAGYGKKKINATIDITKLIMAFLVIGIHTEPFGFNIWLDRGFGIITRLCVPFFFVTSSYFCWKNGSIAKTLQRISLLYVIWSLIYLPYDIIHGERITARIFFWDGNRHALWYLCGSIIGILIVSVLLKFLSPKQIVCLSLLFLAVGCMKSTWAPLFKELFQLELPDNLGTRNGLFYGFPYTALGMFFAKSSQWKDKSIRFTIVGAIFSLIALIAEAFLFTFFFRTDSTVLWMSVFPLTLFIFGLINKIYISIPENSSLYIRKMSTLIYVSHGIFLIAFSSFEYIVRFVFVAFCTEIFSCIILNLSTKSHFYFLKYLY